MAGRHTSVIYVHGVGSPDRDVSLSNFLDFFDLYGQRQSKDEVGKPRKFETKAEMLDDNIIHYVEFKKVNIINDRPITTRTIRVYEAYWVPEAYTKFGIIHIASWMISRLKMPFIVALSRWRSFSPLRLLALQRLSLKYPHPGRLEKLERFYRDFENWEGRSTYKSGTFSQYLKYVLHICHERDRIGLKEAAYLWKNEFRNQLIKSFSTVISIVITAFWIIYIFAYSLVLFKRAATYYDLNLIPPGAFIFLVVLLGVYGLRSGGRYAFDVMAWTLESERDQRFRARRKVVHFAQRLIRHVTRNPECSDCYVVGHSLGTCIATEALLREGERSKLAPKDSAERVNPCLAKIRAVFTVGSPIDLIFSFFQADRTFSHRYNRLYEDKRASIGLPPFWIDGRAGRAKIINIWSRFDPISSTLLSLRKRFSERRDAILNIESLPPGFPAPIGSHISYFADPAVMEMIYKAIMLNDLDPAEQRASEAHIPSHFFLRRTNVVAVIAIAICATFIVVDGAIVTPLVIAAGVATAWVFWRRGARNAYEEAEGKYLVR